QEALVLEEVQVPVTLGDGVVNRMLALHASQREAAAGDEVHPDGERLGRQIEVRARHLPRRRDPQGSLKQLVSHTRSRTCSGPAYPLEIEKRQKIAVPVGQGRDLMVTIQQGLRADGIVVSMA